MSLDSLLVVHPLILALLLVQLANTGQEVAASNATPDAQPAPVLLSVLLANLAEHSQVASAS